MLGMGACESYWDRQIEQMKNKCARWSKPKLSFQGRVHVIKSEIINSIMYAMRSKVLLEKYKTELKKIIWVSDTPLIVTPLIELLQFLPLNKSKRLFDPLNLILNKKDLFNCVHSNIGNVNYNVSLSHNIKLPVLRT